MIITIQIFYLSVILLIIGQALKSFEFINKKLIILYLFIIAFSLNVIFHGISLQSLFEGIVAVSLAVLYYDVIKLIKSWQLNNLYYNNLYK